MAGEIISERWATSNRIGGRHHSGFVGDFTRNQQGEDMHGSPMPGLALEDGCLALAPAEE
jgi:hypothetical protein